MACFLVPGAEAVVVTAAAQVVKAREQKKKAGSDSAKETTAIPLSQKLRWLYSLLWGGVLLLAFEHLWHGEVTPWFPFLTAAGNPEDAAVMLQELGTAGVGMALLVTAVWLGMVAVSAAAEKKALPAAE